MVAFGKPVSEVSEALGIGENLVYCWKSKQGELSSAPAKGSKEVEVWLEVDQLREKLRQREIERGYLKKSRDHFQSRGKSRQT